MAPALLITQCLQVDFVKPIGKHEPLPNLLHVGFEEAGRLMGEKLGEGPIARVIQAAYRQDPAKLRILHIRDWHDPEDPAQTAHLQRFGPHCLQGTRGAEFAFPIPEPQRPAVDIISSLSLNDFQGTPMKALLAPLADQRIPVGLMGVWTEAKVAYLAYELKTRYPGFDLAVCSALTASASRSQHFIALDQMEKLLGIRIFSSVGQFLHFLGCGESEGVLVERERESPALHTQAGFQLSEVDSQLVRFLFRDSRTVELKCLDGGFSGNVVMGSHSKDAFGHEQAPHVVKIGPQESIGQERAAFERVEAVLGNNAPRVTDFVDFRERGAIKYRYASMGGGFSTTFQKLYMEGLPQERVNAILHEVFVNQLGKFYAAASLENCNLLDYYCFHPRWAPGVRRAVESILGRPADGKTLRFDDGAEFPNVCHFYERELERFPRRRADSSHFSHVHGDLNGANIIVDRQGNVWLIDFFHTHRGHVLKDLIKLENDLLYIFTPVENEADFAEALRLTRRLLQVQDLRAPLPDLDETGLTLPAFQRAYRSLECLRAFYPDLVGSNRDPLQLLVGQMRYAIHSLFFEECNLWQKKWALYTAALCGKSIVERIESTGPLRVDWINPDWTAPGKLGLTILPGRRDRGRNLAGDIRAIQEQGVTHVAMLLTREELADYGVPNLRQAYQEAGLQCRHLSILDQRVCSPQEMADLVGWISGALRAGGAVVLHCVGGTGRAGMTAACCLKSRGFTTEQAILEVRRARSPRAVETLMQEEFTAAFPSTPRPAPDERSR